MRFQRAAGFLLLAGGAVAWFFVNQTGTRVLLALLLLLGLGSGLCLILSGRRVAPKWSAPKTLTRGETAELRLELPRPRGLAALTGELVLSNSLTGEERILPLSGPGDYAFTLHPIHSGRVELRLRIRGTDPLGLFSKALTAGSPSPAISVLPRPQALRATLGEAADFLQDSEAYSTARPGYDPSETFRIRAYQPGDPIRQIHWKLTEKTGTTLVRDFGLPVVSRLLLLVEPGRPREEADRLRLDRVLDCLYGTCLDLCREGVAFDLGWEAEDGLCLRRIAGAEDLSPALEALVSPGGGADAVCAAYRRTAGRCAYAHVAVFAAALPRDLDLLHHGNRVTLLLPGDLPEAALTQSQGAMILPLDEGTTELEL